MKLYSLILPYLLLVTFYTPNHLNRFTAEKIAAINNSPYYGVAVPLIGAYDTEKPTLAQFSEAIRRIKRESTKDIWPWIFFNRFIGHKEGDKAHSPLARAPYFQKINAMDIFNQAGALGDFYEIWRLALRAARDLGSPGIIVDPEAYNNYNIYNVKNVSKPLGITDAEVRRQLKAIGAQLVDIVDQEFPQAVLWCLTTGLSTTYKWNPDNPHRTVTYIIMGMLERAKEKRSRLTIVSGGEISLGYCYTNVADLQAKIATRQRLLAPYTESFPHLQLGGPLTVWESADKKTGWLASGRCGQSELRHIADFQPLFKLLFASYNYVWVYAAGTSGYNPYEDNSARNVNAQVQQFLPHRPEK